MPPAPHPTLRFFAFSARLRIEKPVRGDLRRIAATLNNPLKSRPVTALLRRDGLSFCGDMPGKGERGQVPTLRELLADGEVHEAYVRAGAEILETNTFGANPVKLGSFGLADETERINRAAAELARAASGGRASVVGAIG